MSKFKRMSGEKRFGLLAGVSGVLGVALLGAFLMMPTSSFTLDVNPSIEIKANRLDKVVAVNPLNLDAENLLKDFKLKDKDVDDVIEDLVDRMILTGHISGGEDNLIMITVDDDNASSEELDKINKVIAAYLENRQIEAVIAGQTINIDEVNKKVANDYQISPGKLELIRKVMDDDDDIKLEELSAIKLKELVVMAKALNINPDELFDEYLVAIKGVIENQVDDNNDDDYENDDRDVAKNSSLNTVLNEKNNKANFISRDEAKIIALDLAKGKIVEFELDEDDGRYIYDIKIKGNGLECEIELDARNGAVIEFKTDDNNDHNDDDNGDDDDDDDDDDMDDNR